MPETPAGRRLCADQPDGIPHLVDQPRAKRCDQHRAQRHRWSDANRYRSTRVPPLPLLPWEPDPLTPQRRREALRQFADINATQIFDTVRNIRATLGRLQEVRPALTPQARQPFDLGLARLDALAKTLLDIAQVMGWPPDTNAPGRDT
ncbi:MAG: hypothetical protein R2720_02935 [Candidatus Nanopelagicales bacterium]